MLRYLSYRLAAALVPRVPMRPGYLAAAALADIGYAAAPRIRRQVTANLRHVLDPPVPPRQLRTMTRMSFRNLVWNYFEMFRIAASGPAELHAETHIDGLEHLSAAAARQNTGVVVAFGHVGNIEAFSQLSLLLPTHRFVVVVESMADRRLHKLLVDMRRRQGLEVIPTDQPLRVLRRLRAGYHAIICADLDTTGSGVTVQFFGRPMRAPVGAARLALMTGAPLLIAAGWREDMARPHQFRARLSPPLPLSRSGRAEDLQTAVQRVVQAVEAQVAARPEQWLAFRQVWTNA